MRESAVGLAGAAKSAPLGSVLLLQIARSFGG